MRYLKLERNYSPNTLEAYRHDLEWLLRFCREQDIGVLEVTLDQLHAFAGGLHEHVGARSQARVLSGTRSFYRYLVLDGYLEQDPTELLEWPTLPQHLPEVLSTAEVDQIEASIDLSQPQGHRNRAIIEVLFSCGLRVSELVNLRLSDIFEEEHFVRIMGKGKKERLVPISDTTIITIKKIITTRKEKKIIIIIIKTIMTYIIMTMKMNIMNMINIINTMNIITIIIIIHIQVRIKRKEIIIDIIIIKAIII